MTSSCSGCSSRWTTTIFFLCWLDRRNQKKIPSIEFEVGYFSSACGDAVPETRFCFSCQDGWLVGGSDGRTDGRLENWSRALAQFSHQTSLVGQACSRIWKKKFLNFSLAL